MPHLVLTDDDELFRESLGLNLADEGYEVTSFGNGRETLAYLQDGGEADVLLLDWRMPELTGIDVLRQLRRAGIGIPVIFLTALSDDIYEEAALEGGAVDFIDKSRRLPILLKRLELIAAGQRPAPPADPTPPMLIRQGALELRCESHRALWGEPVNRAIDDLGIDLADVRVANTQPLGDTGTIILDHRVGLESEATD